MKIIYNTNFLSKEEVEKIKHDNNDVELIGRDLTPNTPQENLMYSVCLFIISAAVSGPIGNASYDLLKLVWKNFK